ncbi:hypothetical protein BKA83DRAFT_3524291 [Pisolithus microcarpus]|nr:hypothetical protein BKA83DRAFT_3524291 [Pisolithus microcarpus]
MPGFNNEKLLQNLVFGAIARWLKETYTIFVGSQGNALLTFKQIPQLNYAYGSLTGFQLFGCLCGDEAVDRVRLVMTTCDQVEGSKADDMEGIHNRTQWQSVIQAGPQLQRFDNTSESVWNIVYCTRQTCSRFLGCHICGDNLRLFHSYLQNQAHVAVTASNWKRKSIMHSQSSGSGEPSLRNIEGKNVYDLGGTDGLAKIQDFCILALNVTSVGRGTIHAASTKIAVPNCRRQFNLCLLALPVVPDNGVPLRRLQHWFARQ